MPGQIKEVEQKFYDELFRKRGRFNQFQEEIYEQVARESRAGTGGSIALDIGCGSGTQSVCLMKEGFRVISADLSFEATKVARAGIAQAGYPAAVLNADVEALPFANASIDACVCSLFLHHFKNLEGVAKELQRVVRPGGVVVATDANAHNPFCFLFFNILHRIRPLPGVSLNQRAIGSQEIRRVFAQHGFGEFRFYSLETKLRRDWLPSSFGYTLNFYSRALLLKISRAVLPQLARGNLLVSVFRRLAAG